MKNRKQVYIVDYLGEHCGMHYYDEAMRAILKTAGDFDVKILSNFSNDKGVQPFFKNQYRGNKIAKGISLLRNLARLKSFIKAHPEDIFIYLTYGNSIDILFMNIIKANKNHVIDIHEAIAQAIDSNQSLKDKFKRLYSEDICTVISHSTRTDDFLKEYGYSKERLTVPHFRYIFPKEYDKSSLTPEVLNAPKDDKINLLFFGNLTDAKGVDILMEAYNLLDKETASKLNLIIAGKDADGSVERVKIAADRSATILKRHITDDELRHIYSHSDYLCLPYRKTSQSGILEMAFYFKKPILCTNVVYFNKTLQEFPSFGLISEDLTAENYARLLKDAVDNHGKREYFKDSDYAGYENRKEVEEFKKSFAAWAD